MDKLRGEAENHKMTDTHATLKEQELNKKQPSTDEAPSDGTVEENQGESANTQFTKMTKNYEIDNKIILM